MALGEEVIRLDDVRKYYLVGDYIVRALDGVTLSVRRGSFIAIMGPSGSGKSTLMNLIGCLDSPTSGHISIDGEATEDLSEAELADIRNRKVGFVFQQYNLLSKLTVLDNVITPLLYAGEGRKERKERAEAVLEKVGLKDRMRHRPSELSGGQKQRVAIARALVNNPAILLADEPTGALDSKTGDDVMDIFRGLNEEGRTIVLVTHDIRLGSSCPERISIRDGKVVENAMG